MLGLYMSIVGLLKFCSVPFYSVARKDEQSLYESYCPDGKRKRKGPLVAFAQGVII